MSQPVRVAVVGLGYWGPNLVRNFASQKGIEVAAVCDLDPARLENATRTFRIGRTTTSYEDVLGDKTIDAVALATPISTHRPLGEKALRAGKHLWVEKPLAGNAEDARALVDLAREKGLSLFCDHTFLYTSPVRMLRELVAKGELGEPLYFDSVRVNLGLVQKDANVIWDLGPHDLSIAQYVLGKTPTEVSAIGTRHVPGAYETMAYVTLRYDGPLVAHFHLNWLAPVKVRLTMLGGTKKMAVYDDIEPVEKVKIYDKGIDAKDIVDPNANSAQDLEARRQTLISYRSGDVLAPKLDYTEALALAARDFAAAIREKKAPISDGQLALEVVRVLEATQRSLDANGAFVKI